MKRLRHKIESILAYPALGLLWRDRWFLLILGLWRNRALPLSWAEFLAGGSVPLAFRLKKTRGEPIRLRLGDTEELDCFDELFLDNIYDLGRVPFTPEWVIDCGAFRGYFTALAAGTFPSARMACFEANPAHLPPLEAQLSLLSNKVHARGVAVGTEDGRVAFSGEGMGGHIMETTGNADVQTVPMLNFPRWLEDLHPTSLVWKLDVEGAEQVLLPASLPYLPANTALFLETHQNDPEARALLSSYESAGFHIDRIRRRELPGSVYNEWLLLRLSPE